VSVFRLNSGIVEQYLRQHDGLLLPEIFVRVLVKFPLWILLLVLAVAEGIRWHLCRRYRNYLLQKGQQGERNSDDRPWWGRNSASELLQSWNTSASDLLSDISDSLFPSEEMLDEWALEMGERSHSDSMILDEESERDWWKSRTEQIIATDRDNMSNGQLNFTSSRREWTSNRNLIMEDESEMSTSRRRRTWTRRAEEEARAGDGLENKMIETTVSPISREETTDDDSPSSKLC
jgi:hypothetical protein